MSEPNTASPSARTIRIGALARVEGEGALHLLLQDNRVREARLDIYEPPRFFEGFLRGRDFREVPDITARICGICPVAYQMSACHALEAALGVTIDPAIAAMRDLFYCGEWIESHVLHMFFLHLPDFLGYESVLSMLPEHGSLVKRAVQVRSVGNRIQRLLGGRSVHPVGACVGGFYSLPSTETCRALLPAVVQALEEMCELAQVLVQRVRYPSLRRDYEFLALQPGNEYPMNRGPIVSSRGLRVEQAEFLQAIEERQVPHSNALHALVRGRGAYQVGPLARLNLNAGQLHPRAADLLGGMCRTLGADLPWNNTFLSLPARALETVHALARAADLLSQYQQPARSRVPVTPRAGIGAAATEAPRGILWHQYRTQPDGLIAEAHIIPPTAQNQLQIEEDLLALAQQHDGVDDEALVLRCEHLIRNYDPCISCSVHFLRVQRERG